MLSMNVTPEVSKLSGWLNASANCRESKGGHTVRGEVRLWSREAVGDRGARSAQGRARLQIRGSSRGGAHIEHEGHARDAGGVPIGKVLVELAHVVEELVHVGDA